MLPELTNCILDNWNSLFSELEKPNSINYLGIPGSIEGGTTSFLAFSDKNKKPVFAVKVYRYPDAQDRVFNERGVLDFLQKYKGVLAASVPQVILCERISDVWILVQSIMEGRPMPVIVTNGGMPEPKRAANNIYITSNWLAQLHRITRSDTTTKASDLLKEEGIKTIKEFSHLFDLSKSEKDYLEEVADKLETAIGGRTFIQHGDFCRHNILISKKFGETKIGVVDWTDSKRVGFPLHDLFFFITTYYLQSRRYTGLKGFIRAFEDTFMNDTPYNRVIRQCIIEHCKQVDIDMANVKTLFAMFLIERANLEAYKIMRCAKKGNLPRFAIYLAEQENLDYHQMTMMQFWVYFFKTFVEYQKDFIA